MNLKVLNSMAQSKIGWLRNNLISKVIIFIVGIIVVITLIEAWQAQSGTGATCNYQDKNVSRLSYIQIELNRQDPTEPVFYGKLLIYADAQPPSSVTITITGAQNYGNSVYFVGVRAFGQNHYLIGPTDNFGIEPISGSHRLFPFDTASFDTTAITAPNIDVHTFQLINRVDGFVLNCKDISATFMPGRQHLQFKLVRNPIVQITAIVVAIASVGFAILIFRSKSIESVSASAGSSFFSLWTVRSILSSQIHTFPTMLDMIILTSSIVLLLAVLWKVVERHIATDDALD